MNAAGWLQYHSLARHLAAMEAAPAHEPIIHSDELVAHARREHAAACDRLRRKLDAMKAQLPAAPRRRRKRRSK